MPFPSNLRVLRRRLRENKVKKGLAASLMENPDMLAITGVPK